MKSKNMQTVFQLSRSGLLRKAVAAVVLSATAPMVFAQDAANASTEGAAKADVTTSPVKLEKVVVTGSNIKRVDGETTSPVQVITAAELKASGLTSTQDVLQRLTANGQGTLTQGFGGAFAEGASAVSLRGLNAGATLTLIDGKRAAPYPIGDDGQRSFVDISNIPFEAIERIEVLKDGASATYGSDAIAGVVNVILKKKYKGASIGTDYGQSSKRDGETYGAHGIWGFGDMATDGHNFYISGEYRKQNAILYADRGMNNRNYGSVGGNDLSFGVVTPFVSNPASTTGYVLPTSGTTKYFLPGCDAAALAAKQCKFDDTWSYLQPETDNYNVVSRFTQNLTQDWQLGVSGSFFERKLVGTDDPANSRTSPSQRTALGPGRVPRLATTPLPTTIIPSTNPAFPQSARNAGLTQGRLVYNFLNDLGPTETDIDSKSSRLVADVTGTLSTWDVDAAVGYSEVKLDLDDTGLINYFNLNTALANNTFVPGQSLDPSVRDFISPTLVRKDSSKLWFAHVGGSTPLADIGGGQLQLALGADYHSLDLDTRSAPEIEAGTTLGVSSNYSVGKQKVSAVYAELDAPVTKTLDLNAAVRYDRYQEADVDRASPKIGFKYTPLEQVLLRGTFSKGFRAPGPQEIGDAGLAFAANNSSDPVLCPDGNPQTAGNYPSQCRQAFANLQTSSPKLDPEVSTSTTLGIVLEPIKNFSASMDFYRIKVKDQIVTSQSSTIIRQDVRPVLPRRQADGSLADEQTSVGPIAYYAAQYVNANSTTVSGVDTNLRYAVKLSNIGQYKTDFLWSFTNQYDLTVDGEKYHLAGTHGTYVVGAATGNPRSRIQWSHTFSREAWSITGTVNYVSSFSNIDPSAGLSTCYDALANGNLVGQIFSNDIDAGNIPAATSCRVSSLTTFDLYSRYNVTKNLELHGSVLNLFNAKPPEDWITYASQTTAPYNPSFHSAAGIGTYFNIGLNYKF